MNKQLIITALLALVTMTGQGQTAKTATIKGYSPTLKDGTVAESLIDMVCVASDTVKAGHFTMTVPVEKNTANRIMEHIRDAMNSMLQLSVAKAPYEKQDSAYLEMIRQTIEVLPSVPIDIVSITEMSDACHYVRNVEDFPYMEQLKAVEKSFAERAPKGYENELAYIHSLVYPLHVLQPGEEAVDADFFDMKGNAHHLAELRGRYILLDFWSLGCGPCRMAEPEMRVHYYVLLSPDHHIVWKSAGYGPGIFFGMATAIDGPRQENSKNLMLAIRKVEANAIQTSHFIQYYSNF